MTAVFLLLLWYIIRVAQLASQLKTMPIALSYNISTLLELLETCRFLCIDTLVDGIGDYLHHILESGLVQFKDSFMSIDFLLQHKFTTLSNLFLSYIDQNLSSVSSLPEFDDLSEVSMQALLEFEGRSSSEIDLFQAFAKWIKNQDSLPTNIKEDMLGVFDLEKFDKKDLVKTVRKTKLFEDTDILDVLSKHLDNINDETDSKINKIKARNERNKDCPFGHPLMKVLSSNTQRWR